MLRITLEERKYNDREFAKERCRPLEISPFNGFDRGNEPGEWAIVKSFIKNVLEMTP